MNRLLNIVFWVLLSIELVAGIKCSQCAYQLPGKGCEKWRRPCRLHSGESCYKQMVYFGRTPLHTIKGCSSACINVLTPMKPKTVSEVYTCCSDRNFCNH
ncbi:Hypothetical predicted protein [Podarcis lilfordi]|uniref:UPAR/Ly6 domain-containing protein n=1 Tax=Podarcis lilfordi TaxID=74358 RepID=A0AA35LGI5_9SAUR|nr:Hypothetical predicted protein [Podarcis lilfordi]